MSLGFNRGAGHAGARDVMHILTSLDFGGVERHMEIVARSASGQGLRHRFVALGSGGAAEATLRRLGADVHCLRESSRIPSLGALYALTGLLRRERPLVVHCHGAEANFHGLLAASAARVSVRIGEEIGIPGHSPLAKRVFRGTYWLAHRVIGVSTIVTDWLVQSREVPARKAIHIDNPVRLPPKRPESQGWNPRLRICFLGRLEQVKNPSGLLVAFSLLLAHGVTAELWIIGDGSERPQLESAAREMMIQSSTRFLGFQASPERLMHQCDLFVQPSHSEGFGLALVEAMACGLPVISTPVGSAPEIIEPGSTGWLLDDADPRSIAAALLEACELGAERLRAMGYRARGSVEGRFEPALYLERLESLYAEVAGASGAQGLQ